MNDLELQRLEAVAIAAQAVYETADVAAAYGTEGDRFDYIVEVDVPAQAWEALADALNVLDRGKEVPKTEYTEYDDGPWATGGSDSNVDVAGHWHFPGPSVSSTAEAKKYIRIEALERGFLVGQDADWLAFADALDVAEWLLEWLELEEAMIVDGPLHEVIEAGHQWALGVAEAALAYLETGDERDFVKLVEAIKKWRGTEGEQDESQSPRL